jgi:hypothetical protein
MACNIVGVWSSQKNLQTCDLVEIFRSSCFSLQFFWNMSTMLWIEIEKVPCEGLLCHLIRKLERILAILPFGPIFFLVVLSTAAAIRTAFVSFDPKT